MFDKDNSGKIEPDEIKKVIKKFDPAITDKEIDELIIDLDKNNDGQIDFNEFANQFGRKFYTRHPRAELEAAFKYFEYEKFKYFKSRKKSLLINYLN